MEQAILSEEQVRQFRKTGLMKYGKIMEDAQADALRERLWDVMEGRSAKQPEANRNMRGSQEQAGKGASASESGPCGAPCLCVHPVIRLSSTAARQKGGFCRIRRENLTCRD